jgi:hypothetical protein
MSQPPAPAPAPPLAPSPAPMNSGAAAATKKYGQVFGGMGTQMANSFWDYMQRPENKSRLVNILDPLIQHIIQSVFPYIAFSAVLFVLLLIITVLTLIVTLKATGYTSITSLVSIPSGPVLEV